MPDILIVDGYNFLHSLPELVHIKKASLDHARDKLIEELVNYQAYWGGKIIVVFDAYGVQGAVMRREEVGDVEVVYSGEGETADMTIERMIGCLETCGQVFVATSDGVEQRMILGRGALRLPPSELRDNIEKARREMTGLAKGSCRVNVLENRLGDDTRRILEKWRRR